MICHLFRCKICPQSQTLSTFVLSSKISLSLFSYVFLQNETVKHINAVTKTDHKMESLVTGSSQSATSQRLNGDKLATKFNLILTIQQLGVINNRRSHIC